MVEKRHRALWGESHEKVEKMRIFDVGGVDIKNTLLIQHGSCQSEYTEHSQECWVWVLEALSGLDTNPSLCHWEVRCSHREGLIS